MCTLDTGVNNQISTIQYEGDNWLIYISSVWVMIVVFNMYRNCTS